MSSQSSHTNKRRLKRRYASFFDWHRKDRKELGVVEDLAMSLRKKGEGSYVSLKPFTPDPPDCLGIDNDGRIVAFEVTELVSEEAIRRKEQGKNGIYFWQPEQVIARVEAILRDKDSKRYIGGPYSKIVVVIHTDEYSLTYHDCLQPLQALFVRGLKQIGEAYVLFSFDPNEECCPYVRLNIGEPETKPS